MVLQLRELVGDVLGQQVAPGREHLAEFHEDGTELLERHAQPRAPCAPERAPEEQEADHTTQRPNPLVSEKELVETVAKTDPEDLEKAQEPPHADLEGRLRARQYKGSGRRTKAERATTSAGGARR